MSKIEVPICNNCKRPHFGRKNVEDRCQCDSSGDFHMELIEAEDTPKESNPMNYCEHGVYERSCAKESKCEENFCTNNAEVVSLKDTKFRCKSCQEIVAPSFIEREMGKFNQQYTSNGNGAEWRFGMQITPTMIKSFQKGSYQRLLQEVMGRLPREDRPGEFGGGYDFAIDRVEATLTSLMEETK